MANPSSPPSLSTMPATVLDIIIKDASIPEIQILRKVCHHLRHHIDHTHLDYKIQKVVVKDRGVGTVIVRLYLQDGRKIEMKYSKNGHDCQLRYEYKSKILEDQDHATLAANDLGLILKNQKIEELYLEFFPFHFRLSLDCMEIVSGRFLTTLNSHLSSFKVKNLEIHGIKDQVLFMKILPLLDPRTLDSIDIHFTKRSEASITLKIDEMIELDQWKQARRLTVDGLNLACSLRNFVHFEYLDVELRDVTAEEIVLLRETTLQRTPEHRNHICLEYRHLSKPEKKKFLESFGKPYPTSDRSNLTWYYKKNPEGGLDFSWNEAKKNSVFIRFVLFPGRRLFDCFF
uniref:FTH domain-containing protein n=1 Tax=Caenorhabditis tropicalis TaxID=1561998 RepID=A0A1I7TUP6_9PELO